jgi:two-component system, NtrC family, response regulator AtoC
VTVLLMTAYASVQDAVAAMRLGAYHYLTKPFDVEELLLIIDRALEATRLRHEVHRLREGQRERSGLEAIVAGSPGMKALFDDVAKVACSPATTVLITGESGVGKGLVAKAIHEKSDRRDAPFMNVTCTTITESLLESELFGHERGAFTGATRFHKGLFELADGGTVFLDEIGDMTPRLQAKLLRFLQEKTFKRVGGPDDVTVEVRIVAATNQDLARLVEAGSFRQDLYYRLNVIPLAIPPLRERRDDVSLIAESFVRHYNRELGKAVKGITEGALERLRGHDWPGNVRELRNVIERAMILGEGDRIDEAALPRFPSVLARPSGGEAQRRSGSFLLPVEGLNLAKLERDLIEQALRRCKGVKSRAGALIGLNRDQIRYRIVKYGIQYPPEPGGSTSS